MTETKCNTDACFMLGGLFGVASEDNCIRELFFGTDYNTHLGTEEPETIDQ